MQVFSLEENSDHNIEPRTADCVEKLVKKSVVRGFVGREKKKNICSVITDCLKASNRGK
jgi:hypothetical protein